MIPVELSKMHGGEKAIIIDGIHRMCVALWETRVSRE